MTSRPAAVSRGLFELVTLHSLTWLAVANAVGLLLATLLLIPELGRVVEPFSYGRWMAVHLDLQLYGWCSLPLVGLLLRFYEPGAGHGRLARVAVALWSGTLAFGAVSWLAGETQGKLFVDWTGAARLVLVADLAFLAGVLWLAWGRQAAGAPARRLGLAAKGLLLVGLSAVPAVLFRAAEPGVYPPINPDSGGATGGSLLGSTLGIVLVLFLAPLMLGLRPDDGGRTTRSTAAVLVLHGLWFALLDHGNHSHHELLQIVSLVSLVIWLPLLVRHLRRFSWPAACRPWLVALAAWGALLVATGLIDFLPGVLELLKFTNALVAHAHVAMAGLVTCFDVIVLETLLAGTALGGLFAERRAFVLWQAGGGVLVAALLVLGLFEGEQPGLLYRPESAATFLYGVRWLGGLAMTLASVRWLGAALDAGRRKAPASPLHGIAARCAG